MIKHLIGTLLLAVSLTLAAFGQATTTDDLLQKGIALYDAGNYKGALEQYAQALKLEAKNPTVNYEISLTYFALQDMPNTIRYSDVVIKSKNTSPSIKAQALVNKGSALDITGKSAEAITAYRKALKLDPSYQMAYYNLGLTLYNQEAYREAQNNLIEAIQLRPSHASSHLLLAYTMQAQHNRVQSLLAYYNFLLLEPNSERASTAFQDMQRMQNEGVSKSGENTIHLTVRPDQLENSPFSAADLLLSAMQATNISDEKKGKSEEELFYNNTASFFSILKELKKEEQGFWWSYYVDFFHDMDAQGNTEAFCYYIGQSEAAKKWEAKHPEKINELASWYKTYKR
ncbi:tetratricopeptide repeat protein [Pontibacter sp. E15-1]|uniref:tetratricopeptide repeat protein n=1 Tax=Pontibacter sp. E15-1 TaxID=2919918 RepID=UPI001F500885|nr:tetratricopeptide repeat protein [Pontibacter sp. E15-1]MCJ8164654.1 tetratricopeptide repeat protein [Pontibacter sp. E15-1]